MEEGHEATHQALAQLTDRDLERKGGTQKERSLESLFIEAADS